MNAAKKGMTLEQVDRKNDDLMTRIDESQRRLRDARVSTSIFCYERDLEVFAENKVGSDTVDVKLGFNTVAFLSREQAEALRDSLDEVLAEEQPEPKAVPF